MMPPAKFCRVPLRAMPTAMPPAASRAAREVVLMPRVLTVRMMSRTHMPMEMKLSTKLTMVGSALRRRKLFWAALRTRRMIQAPTM